MRHRKKGRRLGRSASHRKAMLKNLASSLILTERDAEFDDNEPKVKGRVVTTLHKAKEVRPLVEKCITIARHSLSAEENARQFSTDAERGSEPWRTWRRSEQWKDWNAAIAPAVAARRRALRLLGSKEAVSVLFEEVAPRMADRDGGYTRILRLASPRLGDAGARAIIEFVGRNDRVRTVSEKPEFQADDDQADDEQTEPTDQAQPTDQPEIEDQADSDAEASATEGDSKS